ncbi:FAD-dependent oxidoreductase [Oceanirhabdus seepicola]|uniref:FAD-dependent oxidoreductase n=1 Tax=Oceanirhabdus seepicola TaxID=2828781 RepID=A0A9J6P1X0_9CLOT|nr:FAD-dependent oxidoreductase [Oceanirhabdus seepicola]MCM1989496.1 FAD-dependent oxidoreductase [Oceanirhabdus seepicola]
MFNKIFESGKIGSMELKNRLVVPAMLSIYANEDGSLSEKYIKYYEEKAKGGWGLIICEDHLIDPRGAGFKNIPGLYSDKFMPEHIELVKRVHAAGSKIAVQLYHAGRQTHSAVIGELPVAPSAIQDPVIGQTPIELSPDEIGVLVRKFTEAALRAKEIGYDAIELQGGHGYLINQFLSPFSNKRTDKYGGNLRNRLRFPLEIIRSIKENLGENYPIIFRISSEELVEGGLTIEDTKTIAIILESAGIAALHASGGVYKSSDYLCAPTAMSTALFSDYASEFKKVIKIPVLTVNKIIYPEVAESLLRENKADFISMGRASIADPHLPQKVYEGREEEIIHCIGCRQGCWNNLLKNKPISCLVNPITGNEMNPLVNAHMPKKIMIIGGGPAGMEAAISAASKGHRVSIFEKKDKLGGQWLLAAIPPGKEILNTLTVWQISELKRLNVTVHLNTDVTEQVITKFNPDHLIIATGANPIMPNILGITNNNVVLANDILSSTVEMNGNIVVIGGGLVGVETAEHIAIHNHNVTIIEMRDTLATDMEAASRNLLLKSLKKNKVKTFLNTTTVNITENSITVKNIDNIEYEIQADQVVIAIGSRPNNELYTQFKNIIPTSIIGDALQVRKAIDATHEGYFIGASV